MPAEPSPSQRPHHRPRLLLLAAGRSSRFGRPKQTVPLGPTGSSLMAYTVVDALKAGFGEVVVVTTPELEGPIRDHLASAVGPGLPVRYAYQSLESVPEAFAATVAAREKPWGTAQAVLCAGGALAGAPFAVANADDWYGPDAWAAMARALGNLPPDAASPTGVAVSYPVASTLSERGGVSRGWLQVDGDGYATRVVELLEVQQNDDGVVSGVDPAGERHAIAPDTPVSMNLWGFPPEVLGLLEDAFRDFLQARASEPRTEFALSTAVDEAIQAERLRIRVVEEGREWFGVTHPGDAPEVSARLEALHAQGVYSIPLLGPGSP